VTNHPRGIVATAQVTAALTNADGTQNIYITNDPAVNALTLTLTNGLSDAIVFPPGTPVAYEELPPGQSAVYIYLNGLIDNTDIANIKLSAPGWAAAPFTDSTGLEYLVIAPSAQVTVKPGGALTFRLTSVLAQGSPRGGTADVLLAGASGVTPLQGDVPLFVSIVKPPQPGKQTLDVQIGFGTPAVYAGQPQSLTLHLVNSGQTALVPGGTTSWHGLTPTFQLTLVYGNGTGALTTVANAANIAMDISNDYGNIWQPPQRRTQGPNPYWLMQPDPNGGGTVLGTGANASIEFAVTGIEATLPAGLDSAITVAYVSWHDVPGYNDGSTAVIITKKAGPRVTTFTADPPCVSLGQPTVQTVLTWDTEHTTGVRFDAPQLSPAQTFSSSGSGPVDGGISVPPGTTLTLIAYKDISSKPRTASGEVTQPADDTIIATATLRIDSITRTDVPTGIKSLSSIVIPAGSARAFLFQGFAGLEPSAPPGPLTRAAILDTSTRAITGTIDLSSLIPSKGLVTVIECTVPSPDGKTIHVLASLWAGESRAEYYILPLHVADATYGPPVALGALAQSGSSAVPALLATPDGRTVYVSACDTEGQVQNVYVHALDAVTYATKGSWTWQARQDQNQYIPAVPIAANADGSVLLMWYLTGLAVFDVSGGFTELATLYIGQHKAIIPWPVVSPDATRAYCCYIYDDESRNQGYFGLLTVDVGLGTGTLSPVNDTQFGLALLNGAAALSPDAKTLYLVAGMETLAAFDTTKFAATRYSCGVNDQFAPLVVVSGTQPGVLYCTGWDFLGTNDTVYIVTIP
jgi:hypothetical protein